MPKFDDTIRQAVMRACKIAGSQAALCKKTGLSTSIMSRYFNGDVRYINPGTWELLYPHVAPYLPEDFQPDTESPFPENLNENICKAVDAAARNHPRGAFGLAADAGFTPAQICRYRHGKVSWFTTKTLNKLYPYIAPYLPERNLRDTESPFPVGTTVRLNSGGPLMTVDGFENGTAFCAWFQGDEISRARFSIPALSVQSDKSRQSREEEK